jgi:hypothetical protein
MLATTALDPSPLATLVIVNARVWTGDRGRPWTDGVSVREGRIDAVGSSAELRKRAGADVLLIDARGGAVFPYPDGVLSPGQPASLVLVNGSTPLRSLDAIGDADIVIQVRDGRVTVDLEGHTRHHREA